MHIRYQLGILKSLRSRIGSTEEQELAMLADRVVAGLRPGQMMSKKMYLTSFGQVTVDVVTSRDGKMRVRISAPTEAHDGQNRIT